MCIRDRKDDNAEFHWALVLLLSGSRDGGSSRRSSLLARGPAFFGWRLTIALFQVRDHDAQHELLFTVLIELDDNVLFGAGNNGTEAKLRVFNLSSLREGWFKCHCGGIPLLGTVGKPDVLAIHHCSKRAFVALVVVVTY